MALQPGRGKIEGRHYLPSTPETISWGSLPTARTRPVLSVDSGTTVTIDTVSQEGILDDQGRDPDAFLGGFGVIPSEVLEDARAIAASGVPHRFGSDGPHIVTGPISVRGAVPGDVLRVDVLSLHPRARYGVISTRHGAGLLAGEFPETPAPASDADARRWQGYRTVTSFCAVERRRGRLFGTMPGGGPGRVRFPLRPCLGIMAVAADILDGPVPSTSAGPYGGALDCGDLGPGTHLYLPVRVPGALFAVGGPHYAVGDGMIGATALEGPLRATLRLAVLQDAAATGALGALRAPFIETEELWVTTGFDPDPREAVRAAARAAVTFLQTKAGLQRADAVAYLAAAADFAVGRLAAGHGSAFCRIRRADFTEPAAVKSRLPRAGFTRKAGNDHDPERDPAPTSPPVDVASSVQVPVAGDAAVPGDPPGFVNAVVSPDAVVSADASPDASADAVASAAVASAAAPAAAAADLPATSALAPASTSDPAAGAADQSVHGGAGSPSARGGPADRDRAPVVPASAAEFVPDADAGSAPPR